MRGGGINIILRNFSICANTYHQRTIRHEKIVDARREDEFFQSPTDYGGLRIAQAQFEVADL